jgi:hypothetical protein
MVVIYAMLPVNIGKAGLGVTYEVVVVGKICVKVVGYFVGRASLL